MFDYKAILAASVNYLKAHPDQFLRSARKASRWTFTLPIAALNWLAREFSPSGGPRDLQVTSSASGLRVEATVEQMNTLLRASSVVSIENVGLKPGSLTLELRLSDVDVRLLDATTQTPLAALIRSQTLDLTRVASLVAYLPSRPAALTEAEDDRLVIDLMKLPRLSSDARMQAALKFLSAVVAVDRVCTEGEHFEITLRPLPQGLFGMMRTRLLGRAG